ncbi:MAG: 16S rRNA (adenine(1518)-N(6)/adenine(1519)-N(6))-dimethyltransferase RsmA [Gammaproteobacteria bacterium]|nr:MAG: 16S rRNA (adenine(1518)-N(6)/adenine(1519)-N(6))-dimethyltransferase RsmA [Gammaproteobacteria bacterium]
MTGHRPRKRFGQHFLHDPAVIDRIISALGAAPDDHIVEIGPGEGALTEPLLERVNRLDVVELDRDLAARLKERAEDPGKLRVHQGDALEFDFCSLATNGEQLRVIGNLPYNISTPLLFHLLEQRECIADMHVMLQKEVADRIVATPGTSDYGRLGVMIQFYCDVERLFRVSAGAFRPPPKVESTMLRLRPLPRARFEVRDEAVFAELVKQAFGQRRKTLRNAAGRLLDTAQIEAAGVDPGLRPQQLSVEQFARLSDQIHMRP